MTRAVLYMKSVPGLDPRETLDMTTQHFHRMLQILERVEDLSQQTPDHRFTGPDDCMDIICVAVEEWFTRRKIISDEAARFNVSVEQIREQRYAAEEGKTLARRGKKEAST